MNKHTLKKRFDENYSGNYLTAPKYDLYLIPPKDNPPSQSYPTLNYLHCYEHPSKIELFWESSSDCKYWNSILYWECWKSNGLANYWLAPRFKDWFNEELLEVVPVHLSNSKKLIWPYHPLLAIFSNWPTLLQHCTVTGTIDTTHETHVTNKQTNKQTNK